MIDAADLITGSGLSNAELYAAVEANMIMLITERQMQRKNKVVAKGLNAVLRTLASVSRSQKVLPSNGESRTKCS